MIYKNGTGHETTQLDEGKYELINLNSISIDGGLKPSGKFIDEDVETLKKDDLVMVLSDVAHGDLLGRVAIIPLDNTYVLNQRVALLRTKLELNSHFLMVNINSNQKYFKMSGAGSSQLNISRGCVEDCLCSIPSLNEQDKVSRVFMNIDNTITLHQRKLFNQK